MTPARLVVTLVLAALSAGAAAYGMYKGGSMAAAFLGYPGAVSCLFFVLVARVAALDRAQVAKLGTWLLYAGGAAAVLGLGCGLFAIAGNLRVARMALPVTLLATPFLAIASLRLSTAPNARARALQVLAAGFVLMAIGCVQLLGRAHEALGF
jgi:hypothetical protein